VLGLERLRPDTGDPVDRVLQHSRHGSVVLRRGDDERVALLEALAQGEGAGRQPFGGLHVAVVQGHVEVAHGREVDGGTGVGDEPGHEGGKAGVGRIGS
jgi:hypothetical protein